MLCYAAIGCVYFTRYYTRFTRYTYTKILICFVLLYFNSVRESVRERERERASEREQETETVRQGV